jgi:hypothetical protein
LEGAPKEKAISEGACLECGSTAHWWRNCPNLKPKGFGFEKARPTRSPNTRKKRAYVHDGAAASSNTGEADDESASDKSDTETPNADPDSSSGDELD